MTKPRLKARRRPGPWRPIEPTVVPCRTMYVSAIGESPELDRRNWYRIVRGFSDLDLPAKPRKAVA